MIHDASNIPQIPCFPWMCYTTDPRRTQIVCVLVWVVLVQSLPARCLFKSYCCGHIWCTSALNRLCCNVLQSLCHPLLCIIMQKSSHLGFSGDLVYPVFGCTKPPTTRVSPCCSGVFGGTQHSMSVLFVKREWFFFNHKFLPRPHCAISTGLTGLLCRSPLGRYNNITDISH